MAATPGEQCSVERPDQPPRSPHGGVIHTYQKFDPREFPSPTAPPPDLASVAMEHMLHFGSLRHLTPDQLAEAITLDPSQFAGLGPPLDALIRMLQDRKRKILSTYETARVRRDAAERYSTSAAAIDPPAKWRDGFKKAAASEQIPDLESVWYRTGGERSPIGMHLLALIRQLGEKYQVEELAARYEFTGRTPMSIPGALEVKEELEAIDRLLEQLREAMKNAKVGSIDLEELSRFAEQADIDALNAVRQQIEDYLREQAALQGLEHTREGYALSPAALRLFQGRVLTEIFSSLAEARSGRHTGPVTGDGAVELPRTKPYEFGDSAAHMDAGQSIVNAAVRRGAKARRHERAEWGREPFAVLPCDLEIHRTRNTPKCATAVLMDMSGSMRHDGQYVNVKRMALGLDGLIRREYPGDFLALVEMATFARPCRIADVPALMPRPVTTRSPVVRLKVDMNSPEVTESLIPPHFTNIQHALRLARRMLTAQDTPNRQIVLITDGLPTAHFEGGSTLYMLYPPDPRTEEATMREGRACRQDGITINIFLLPSWWQSSEDVQFAHRLAEETRGRVFFTGGRDIDRFVLWDYVNQRRSIIG
ncbi:MAG: VWA domain-containing protein [Phycisphaerales bacterium]|nr:VWA domain-containing protein [Phycisphaerales bacterium]